MSYINLAFIRKADGPETTIVIDQATFDALINKYGVIEEYEYKDEFIPPNKKVRVRPNGAREEKTAKHTYTKPRWLKKAPGYKLGAPAGSVIYVERVVFDDGKVVLKAEVEGKMPEGLDIPGKQIGTLEELL